MRAVLPLIVILAIVVPSSGMSRTKVVVTPPPDTADLGFEILIDGTPLRELSKGDRRYVEAIRDKEYSVRVTNRTDGRLAVALSVDGLNTIDAKHTTAKKASKWVIEAGESLTVSGWQVSEDAARRFVFTGERSSYGAAVGDTRNLGIISAVAFREKRRPVATTRPRTKSSDEDYDRRDRSERPAPSGSVDSSSSAGAGGSEPSVRAEKRKAPRREAEAPADSYELDDERASTGSGDRVDNSIEWVTFELDPTTASSVELRYGFRSELIELGVLPKVSPKERRERASGFALE